MNIQWLSNYTYRNINEVHTFTDILHDKILHILTKKINVQRKYLNKIKTSIEYILIIY